MYRESTKFAWPVKNAKAKLSSFTLLLNLIQYKNDSIQSKIILIFKLPSFFCGCIDGEKARQFQSWNYFCLNGVILIFSTFSDLCHPFFTKDIFRRRGNFCNKIQIVWKVMTFQVDENIQITNCIQKVENIY